MLNGDAMMAAKEHLIKLAVLVALLELALDVVGQLLGLLRRLLLILGRSRRCCLLLYSGLHAVVLRVVLLERRRVHLNDCALHQRLRPHLHTAQNTSSTRESRRCLKTPVNPLNVGVLHSTGA